MYTLLVMNIYLESLGCKLNQSEMEGMARSLHRAGHRIVYDALEADICLLNSCAVTGTAAHKTRQAVRRLRRENPAARLVVLGCYAELWPAELVGLDGVEALAGPAAKSDIVAALGAGGSPAGRPLVRQRTRAFVKVQDGCNEGCTYCVVRIARGRERSRPLAEVVAEVRDLAGEGVQEVVLTGVHVGAYGRELGLDLGDLVRAILAETDLPRLRLSSVEPWHLEPRFLELWREPRLCRHLHLPLQSGSEATLHRMNRRYTPSEFRSLVAGARAAIPGLAVSTDVMVGFPGETEAEFAASLGFVQEMAFSRLHIFRYSRRPGTAAARMPAQVAGAAAAERAERMRAAGAAASLAFHAGLVGQTLPVLWESVEAETGRWVGLTDNYARVTLESLDESRLHGSVESRPHSERLVDLHNRIVPATIVAADEEGVAGRLASQTESDLTGV